MDEKPSPARVRMRAPTSRWRDPDVIAVPMFAAAFVAIVALVTGGSETYLYVDAQRDPASRIGVCSAKPTEQCVTITQVYVIGSSSDQVTLRTVDGSQEIDVKRIGGADASAFPRHDSVYVECYLGDEVAVSNHRTGALMKLANYPEPALRLWVPELSVGLFCLTVWVGLFLWRRYLFKTLVVSSTP
jgi:hypothetical protein